MENNKNDTHNQKWPWSITDREFGAMEQEVIEIRHDLRNIKHIIDNNELINIENYNNTINELKESHKHFKEDLTALKIKVYTAFSVIAVLGGIIIWLVDIAQSVMK
jgi:hypothetical protein